MQWDLATRLVSSRRVPSTSGATVTTRDGVFLSTSRCNWRQPDSRPGVANCGVGPPALSLSLSLFFSFFFHPLGIPRWESERPTANSPPRTLLALYTSPRNPCELCISPRTDDAVPYPLQLRFTVQTHPARRQPPSLLAKQNLKLAGYMIDHNGDPIRPRYDEKRGKEEE